MLTFYIEVHHGGSLFFSTTANTEAHAREVYRALYDRFDRGQGFQITVVQQECISEYVDAEARWS